MLLAAEPDTSSLSTDHGVAVVWLLYCRLAAVAAWPSKTMNQSIDRWFICLQHKRWIIPVFEKTCEATQKDVKSHVFWILKKNRKTRKKRTGRPTQPVVSQAT